MRGDSRPMGTGGEAVDSRSRTEANSLTGGQERSVKAAGLKESKIPNAKETEWAQYQL
jgi:hypothetical protein